MQLPRDGRKVELAILVYAGFFLVSNFAGISMLGDIAWAPYIESTSNSNPPSGAAWVENKGLHWADGSNEYYMDYRLLRGEYNLDTGSGSTAYDNSEYSNDGTINGATWVSGKHGSALNFDGADDSVNLGSPSSLQVSSDLTICMWLNPDNLGAQRENPIDKAYGAEFSFTFEDDNDHSPGTLSTYFGSSGGNSGPYATNRWTDVATDGTWSHICWVRNIGAKEVTLYKNGQNWNSYQTSNEWETPVTSSHDLVIGNGYTNSFNGQIDEVILINRALSQQEVKNIYSGSGSKTGGSSGNTWIEGESLHWIDSNGIERSFVGGDTGNNVGNSGDIWIESGYIHYVDQNGNERTVS